MNYLVGDYLGYHFALGVRKSVPGGQPFKKSPQFSLKYYNEYYRHETKEHVKERRREIKIQISRRDIDKKKNSDAVKKKK